MPKVRCSRRNSSRKIAKAIKDSKNNLQRQTKQTAQGNEKIKVRAKKNVWKRKKINKKRSSFSKQLVKENYYALKKLSIPLKKISHLSKNKRMQLKQSHPKLAPYLFLSVVEKKKYFQKKNKEYKLKMKCPGVKKKNQAKFLDTNQVLYFNKHEPSAQIEKLEVIVQKTKRKNKKNQKYYYHEIK